MSALYIILTVQCLFSVFVLMKRYVVEREAFVYNGMNVRSELKTVHLSNVLSDRKFFLHIMGTLQNVQPAVLGVIAK